MKHLTRYLSVLLCFLLLSIVFSLSASAETVNTKNLEIVQQSYLLTSQTLPIGEFTFYPNNGEYEIDNPVLHDGTYGTMVVLSSGFKLRNNYTVSYADGSNILEKDKAYKVNLSSFYFSTLVEDRTGIFYANRIGDIQIIAVANDGTQYTISNYNSSQSDDDYINYTNCFDLSFEVSPEKPIKSFLIIVNTMPYSVKNSGSNYVVPVGSYLGEWNDDNKYSFSLEVESQEAGLLKGLLGKITELWNTTKDGFSNLTNGITNVFNSIKELPSKLWNLISEGLKSLFVPSEEYITQFKTDMETLLAEKLGAVYQVLDITFNSWDRINDNDTANVINLPKTTINLPDNNIFSFGGYDIDIVPNGFEFIVSIIKTVVGIVCTILFVNGLRRRYDEIMGVEQ